MTRWRGGFKERGHSIVDFQDAALGAVLAIFLFVFAFDDGNDIGQALSRTSTGCEYVIEVLICLFDGF